MRLLKIIAKNFKLLTRSKTSVLVMVLGPLLLILLIGLAFNNISKTSLTIGTFIPHHTELTDEIIEKFMDKNYDVINYMSASECIENAKYGVTHTCLVFPKNFQVGGSNEIGFYVDYSEINLAYILVNIVTETISEEAKEVSTDLTTNLLTKIDETKIKLEAQKNILLNLDKSQKELQSTILRTTNDIGLMNFDIDFSVVSGGSIISKITEVNDVLEEIDDLLNDIESEAEASCAMTPEFDELMSEAENLTNAAKSYLKGDASSSNQTSVQGLVNELSTAVHSIEDSLDEIKLKKNQANNNLGKSKTVLTTSFTYLSDLLAGIDESKDNLETLEIRNATIISAPITTSVRSLTKESTHFNFLFPLLIVLVVMTTSILFSSTLVMSEKKTKAFFRNHISPTSMSIFNLAIFFTALIINMFQIFIFLIVASFFFKVDLLINLGITIGILFIITTLFILLGMLIGSIFKTNEGNTLASITISSILLFFSRAVLPLETMPEMFRNIAQFNPFVISIDVLKQSLFFKLSILNLMSQIGSLLVYIVIFVVIIFAIQKIMKIYMLFHIHKKSAEAVKKKDKFKELKIK